MSGELADRLRGRLHEVYAVPSTRKPDVGNANGGRMQMEDHT